MLWGRGVNINGITIALISYKEYISWTTRHFMHRIFCFRLCFDIGITCKQRYKLRSFHFVRCAFLGLLWLVNKHTLKPWMFGVWQRVKSPALCKGCIGVKAGHDCPRRTRVTSTVHAGKAAYTYDITCSTVIPRQVEQLNFVRETCERPGHVHSV